MGNMFADEERLKKIIAQTVHETLLRLGIDSSKPIQTQADFHTLRTLGATLKSIKRTAILATIGFFTTGTCTLILLGVKFYLNK